MRVFRPINRRVVKQLTITREPPREPLTPGLRPKEYQHHEPIGFWHFPKKEDDDDDD